MEKTSNVFPVPWGQTLSRIRQADGEDVLNESNYTYLMFLVVYCLVEFPALRVVLAYDFVTKNDITTSNQVGLATVRVLIALLLLPLLLAVWTILVVWSILRWTGNTIWTLPSQIWSDADEQSKNQYLEQEKPKSADGIENKGRWGLKDAGGRNEEKYRQDRKAKEERVRKQVSLLINPPELYKDKLKPYNEKIKALTLREKKGSRKNRTNSVMSDHSSSAPSQPTQQRRIWPFARHGTEKATNDKEGV